jgi:hypothetical protein
LVALVQELANESAQAHIRSAAGVALKNTLIAKEADRKAEYARRWLSADKQSTETVKQGALMTLRTASPQAATQAAQVRWGGRVFIRVGDCSNCRSGAATQHVAGFDCALVEQYEHGWGQR